MKRSSIPCAVFTLCLSTNLLLTSSPAIAERTALEDELPSLRLDSLPAAVKKPVPKAPKPPKEPREPTDSKESKDELVTLNFVNADIEAVIRAVGKMSGKNFLIDPRVKGTLSVTSQQPVDKSLTYQILLSALRMQGYAAVESRGVVKILPETDAKLHGVPFSRNKSTLAGDQIITEVFQVHNESAAQLVPVIRPLVSPNNTVAAYAGNNTLVITDYAENMARIRQVLNSIDVPQGNVRVIPVENASAIDLAGIINRLVVEQAGGASSDPSQRVTVIADPRSNSLLVRSDNPSKIASVRSLVRNLDQPGAAGNIRVVYLKNAEATKVAQTLRAVLSGDTSAQSASSTPASSSMPSPGSGLGSSPSNNSSPTSAASAQPAAQSGGGIIQADPTNNALIITASEPVYNNLRKVIDQLDRRRAQVFVEALIVEMTAQNAAEFGIQWLAGNNITTARNTDVYGGTSFGSRTNGTNIFGVAANPTSVANGMNILVGAGTITFNGVTIANLNMLAHFLNSTTKINILSTPTLVTLDNEEARIIIGQNVPFVTGSYAQTNNTATVNPFQTVDRKDVGVSLKIKPQISEGGTVRLTISQESSAVVSTSPTLGPTTNKRSIDSTVLVDDGAIVALGGLIEDQLTNGSEKVPLLGDIPILGDLFRYDNRNRTKTNLVVFLRPKILRDGEAYAELSNDRYDQILGTQRQAEGERALAPSGELPPLLPPRTEAAAKEEAKP